MRLRRRAVAAVVLAWILGAADLRAADEVAGIKIVPSDGSGGGMLHAGQPFRIELTVPDSPQLPNEVPAGARDIFGQAGYGGVPVKLRRGPASGGLVRYSSGEVRLCWVGTQACYEGGLPWLKAEPKHGSWAFEMWTGVPGTFLETHFNVFVSEEEKGRALDAQHAVEIGKLIDVAGGPATKGPPAGDKPASPAPPKPEPAKPSPSPSPPAAKAEDALHQKMAVDGGVESVVHDLDPRGGLQIQDKGVPRGPAWAALGRFFTPRPFALFASASLGVLRSDAVAPLAQPDPARTPMQLLLVSLGKSTGEAFTAWVIGEGPLPKRLLFDGLVVEPLSKEAQREAERQIRKLAGRKAVAARVDAYCLEYRRLPPAAGQVFRVARAEAQRGQEPSRRILRATRRLRDGERLHPDSDAAGYFHSIRQWAVWTMEQRFDERAYADAFVSHTRKNVEASGQKWTKEREGVIRGAAPNRWRDIQTVLAEARLR